MALTKTENGVTYWLNRNGKYIPLKNVQKHMQRKDKVVDGIIGRVVSLRERMKREKLKIISDVNKYLSWHQRVILKEHGIKDKDHNFADGNVILSNYANTAAVELKINNMIVFDEQLQVAKKMVDSCVKRWSKGSRNEIRLLVDDAFNVDKKGKINTWMILRLTKYNINDKEWKAAMKIILDSMQVAGTRQYLNMKVRKDKDSKWQTINLSFSSLDN